MLLDDSVEHRLFWTVLQVARARFSRHALPAASPVPKGSGGVERLNVAVLAWPVVASDWRTGGDRQDRQRSDFSLFVIESDVGRNVSCTDDCGVSSCTAENGPLSEGDYTVVYGDREETFSASTDANATKLFADDSPIGAYLCEESND